MRIRADPLKALAPDLAEAIAFLRPKPSPARLVRIGPDGDGGYLVPQDFEGVKHLFSPGVQNRKDFEDQLTRGFGIKAHLADFSSDVDSLDSALIEGMQTFTKKWIAATSGGDGISFEDWVSEVLKPEDDDGGDFIMQMDIEGGEYEVIPALSEKLLLRFRIIVIELHGLDALLDKERLVSRLKPLLQRLQPHYTVAHAHPNNCCREFQVPNSPIRIPKVLEVTLLRNDRFQIKGAEVAKSVHLPHRLDIKHNVPTKRPLHLDQGWVENSRPFASWVRVFLDYLRFFLFWRWRQMVPPVLARELKRLFRRS